MIRVHPTIYRLLWITCAVFGVVLLVGPLALLSDGVTATNDTSRYVLLAGGACGLFVLLYALRRLLWPLRSTPPQA